MYDLDDKHKEETYFSEILRILLHIGIDESRAEDCAHDIMDVWTFDGKVDYNSLDKVMEGWVDQKKGL